MFRPLVRVVCLAGSLVSVAVLPLRGQEKGAPETKAQSGVPQSAQPPAGLCRVWLENVPARQQPAPTDCATAIKNRPNNARIVFGGLNEEAAKPQQRTAPAPSTFRAKGWDGRSLESRQGEGSAGVRTVNVTAPGTRPTSDSGPRRRP